LLWVVNAYLLMLAALILVGGALGDKLGRKRVFMAGISLFVVASIGCGLAPTIEVLIWARLVEGIGGALMIPGSLAIITAFFDPTSRGRAIGTWSAVTTLVTVIGPLLGGFLANAGLWRGVFLINVPLGILALLILQSQVPESQSEDTAGSIDVLGAALQTLGLAGLTYGFISAPDAGFANPVVAISLAGGVVALVAFVFVEIRSRRPIMPLRLFNSCTFQGTNLLTLFLYGALSVSLFFQSLNLVQVQGYSLALAGVVFSPFAVMLMGLSRWAGGLADKYGPRPLLVAGPLLAGTGFLWFAMQGVTAGPSQYWITFFPAIVLLGAGMGLTVAPLSTAVMNSAATHLAGSASGVNNAVSRAAGVLAIAVVGAAALTLFSHSLGLRTAALGLPPAAQAALQSEAGSLGAAVVPPEVPPAAVDAVDAAIKLAFIDAYRAVMLVSTALAWLAAAMAYWLVERNPAPG